MKIFTPVKWLTLFCLLLMNIAIAQPSLSRMKEQLIQEQVKTSANFQIVAKMPAQGSLLIGDGINVAMNSAPQWLADKLQLRKGVDAITFVGQPTVYENITIQKLQQYYKGIKVEHGVITAAGKEGKLAMLQMEFYTIPDDLAVAPKINERAALLNATGFIGASKYAWEVNGSNDVVRAIPKGELVIVEDILQQAGKMCLAYKFNIHAEKPFSKTRIYVNALNGKVVFEDAIIKKQNGEAEENTGSENIKTPSLKVNQPGFNYPNQMLANAVGTAQTNYSGSQSITTTQVSPSVFILQETGRGDNTTIRTRNLNHAGNASADTSLATDYTASDNIWEILEDYPEPNPGVELDAHWAMEKIVDYWWSVHGRKSYDNANATITNYVHWGGANNNQAQWDSEDMAIRYGDGAGINTTNGKKPFVSLDVIGHEFGHAIAGYTAKFVAGREFGALDEAFGDIWGACVENYVSTVVKRPFLVAEDIEARSGHISSRSMIDPHVENQPDTYKDAAHFWRDVSHEGCPDVTDASDYCGVHSNMGVLNKWFYIITHGDTAINGNNFGFAVVGLGFAKTEKLVFATEQLLTPNSGYETMMIATFNAATLLGMSADLPAIKAAWKAVGVFADTLYTQANSALTTNDFKAIGVGSHGMIWAGTANAGLFRYDGLKWEKAPVLTNHNIGEIKADTSGGIWIAQYGKNSANSDQGGIDYFADSSFKNIHYSDIDGLPTRGVRSIFINNEQTGVVFPQYRVWTANFSDITAGETRVGSVGRGNNLNPAYFKGFKKITDMLDLDYGVGTQVIAGNKNEVWAFAASNNSGQAQLLRYNAVTADSIGRLDYSNTILPAGFVIKALYHDNRHSQWWVGLQSGAVYICQVSGATLTWLQAPVAIFPPATGTIVNNNAITGDKNGNIFIGTNTGYVLYGSLDTVYTNAPSNASLYKRFTKADGLPSSNIKSICVDTIGNRLILASDSGIVFKYNLCKECAVFVFSVKNGNWNDPTTWNTGSVPAANANVYIRHNITVNSDIKCKSLNVKNSTVFTVAAGAKVEILSSEQ